ncbi:hypothetical protein [Sporolactobacillus sp. KGMB 08714]|uniref:hypothetical protein n=1 Tax=Sporolactobacillus sp. KGMB 08714 TaxID=3064704 RepID=UPI002FBD42CF
MATDYESLINTLPLNEREGSVSFEKQIQDFFNEMPTKQEHLKQKEKELAAREGIGHEEMINVASQLGNLSNGFPKVIGTLKPLKSFESAESHEALSSPLQQDEQKVEPSERLEKLALMNTTNDNFLQIYRYLINRIEKNDRQFITRHDMKQLLDDHFKRVEHLLECYQKEKEKPKEEAPKGWPERLDDYKKGLKEALIHFKDQVKEKLQVIAESPERLKKALQNRMIDGLVHVNRQISEHTEKIAERLAAKRTELKATKPLDAHDQLLTDYRTEYKKLLFNDYVGSTYHSINSMVFSSVETTDKANVSYLKLRQQAIFELSQDMVRLDQGGSTDMDVQKFNRYLVNRNEQVSQAQSWDERAQTVFLKEDLGVYSSETKKQKTETEETEEECSC